MGPPPGRPTALRRGPKPEVVRTSTSPEPSWSGRLPLPRTLTKPFRIAYNRAISSAAMVAREVSRPKDTALRIVLILAFVAAPTVAVAASTRPAKPVLRVTPATGGIVRSSDGRINCPRRCSVRYRRRAVRELDAEPNRYFDFRGWTGSCFGYVPRCVLDVDRPTNVRALFARKMGSLLLSVTGSGAIEVEPGGAIVRGTGYAQIPEGEPITLTPRPDAGASLKGWAEACADAPLDGCTVTGDNISYVAAAFGQTTPGEGLRTLSVDVAGPATVTSTPSGIDCPGTCSASFSAGTLVALRSSAPSGYGTYWEGGGTCDVRSYVPTCLLVLDTSTSVSAYATQDPYQYPLQGVVVTVSGPGAVSADLGDIRCGRHFGRYCAAAMDPRDDWTLRLSAIPGPHARFGGWQGDCHGKRPHCTVSKGSFDVLAFFRRR